MRPEEIRLVIERAAGADTIKIPTEVQIGDGLAIVPLGLKPLGQLAAGVVAPRQQRYGGGPRIGRSAGATARG